MRHPCRRPGGASLAVCALLLGCGGSRAPRPTSEPVAEAGPAGSGGPGAPASPPPVAGEVASPPARIPVMVHGPVLGRDGAGALLLGWLEVGAGATTMRVWAGTPGAWAALASPIGEVTEEPRVALASGAGRGALRVIARDDSAALRVREGARWRDVRALPQRLVASAAAGERVVGVSIVLGAGAGTSNELVVHALEGAQPRELGRLRVPGRVFGAADAAIDPASGEVWVATTSCVSQRDVDTFVLVDCRVDAARFGPGGARALPSAGAVMPPDDRLGVTGLRRLRLAIGRQGPVLAFVRQGSGAAPAAIVLRAWNERAGAWAAPSPPLPVGRPDRWPGLLALDPDGPTVVWADADEADRTHVRVSRRGAAGWTDVAPSFDPLAVAPIGAEFDDIGLAAVVDHGAPLLLVTRERAGRVRLLRAEGGAWRGLALPAEAPPPPEAPAAVATGLRPIAPLSGARCTGQRPTFRFGSPPAGETVRLELCRDPACGHVERAVEVRGGTYRPDVPLAAGRWTFRLRAGAATTPVWSFALPARDAPVTACGLSSTDVDGDGHPDAAFGEPAVGATRGWLFRGDGRGLEPRPAAAIAGFAHGDGPYGRTARTAGDVDGDGFGDVLVLTPTGRIFLYRGSRAGLAREPSSTLAPTGQPLTLALPAGDVDGDGYGDLLVTDDDANGGAGQAFVFRGGLGGWANTPSFTLAAPDGGRGHFGRTAAAGSDLDGDGFADLAIAAPYVGHGQDGGRVHVYRGGPRGPAAQPSVSIDRPTGGNQYIGSAVAMAGDLDGDGRGELAVSSDLDYAGPTRGKVYVFAGSASGVQSVPSVTLPGPSSDTSFGSALAGPGDLDGDGRDDLVVSLHESDRVLVYRGRAGGPATTPSQTLEPPATDVERFGTWLLPLGDLDGDGRSDLFVGAERIDTTAGYVYRGGPGGLVTTPVGSVTLTVP